jgi:hypothetical protein
VSAAGQEPVGLLAEALGEDAPAEALLLAARLAEPLMRALETRIGHVELIEGETTLAGLPAHRRYPLGVVAGQLETLQHRTASQLLARLRDQVCARVLVLVAPDAGWSRSDLLALGYNRIGRSQGPARWSLYEYEITRYNPERTWNNPSDWANPENFDKYRW